MASRSKQPAPELADEGELSLYQLTNKRIAQAREYVELAKMAYSAYRWLTNKRVEGEQPMSYELVFGQSTQGYQQSLKLLVRDLKFEASKRLIASYDCVREYDDEGEWAPQWVLRGLPQFNTATRVELFGHEYVFYIEEPESMTTSSKPQLVITCNSIAAREAFLSQITDDLNTDDEDDTRQPGLYVYNRQRTQWSDERYMPPRPVESVILRRGQMERIIADVENFYESEKQYVRRTLPWHRGYLFYGPPGTGKSSLARALSTATGRDLWYLPLKDITSNSKLAEAVADVHNGILLLEDVDVFLNKAQRDGGDENQADLSGLLNALDGVITPHGLVVILTTNDRDAIDPALLRAGRIDLQEEILPPDDDQVERMFEWFYERKPRVPLYAEGYNSSSAVVELFKTHIEEPDIVEQILSNGEDATHLSGRLLHAVH